MENLDYMISNGTGHLLQGSKSVAEVDNLGMLIDLANRYNKYEELLQGMKDVRSQLIDCGFEPTSVLILSIDNIINKAK